MKKYYYYFLMMLLSVMSFIFFYYISVFSIVYYGLVDKYYIECFLDYTLSPITLVVITIIALVSGYKFAKKWWKIIYVDGVYYFHKNHR